METSNAKVEDKEIELMRWKRFVQDLAHSLHIQNSEQIERPDVARAMFTRHVPQFKLDEERRNRR